MIRLLLAVILYSIIVPNVDAQSTVFQTFKDTRVINAHSVETLPANNFDFRISHRFGDMFGDQGGWSTLYGLESAADILFGLDFGVTDYLTIGVSRTKGNGPLQKLINGFVKFKIQEQNKEGNVPFSLSILGLTSFSTMGKSSNPEDINYFNNFFERNIINGQVILARKFSPSFSMQISGGYIYRNIVLAPDENDLVNLGLAFRIQLSRVIGLIGDFTVPLSNYRTAENGFYNPVGIGFEFDTGGHVFQVNFTNSKGIMATDFIPYTQSDFREGEFRLGFTISRRFNIR